MLEIKLNGIDYSLKNNSHEFLIGDYERIAVIMNNDNLDEIDKYSQLFIELGIPEEELEKVNTIEFFQLIKKYLDNSKQFNNKDLKQFIELNGRNYKSYDEEFFITVKDMKTIEKYIKKNEGAYIGEILAVLFKDVELSKNEHHIDAHIKYKAKLIRENITLDIAIPFIAYFSEEVINSLQIFKETQEVNED